MFTLSAFERASILLRIQLNFFVFYWLEKNNKSNDWNNFTANLYFFQFHWCCICTALTHRSIKYQCGNQTIASHNKRIFLFFRLLSHWSISKFHCCNIKVVLELKETVFFFSVLYYYWIFCTFLSIKVFFQFNQNIIMSSEFVRASSQWTLTLLLCFLI
jgi:hypothetical protein